VSKPISRQNGKNAAVNLRITVSQKQKQELEARAMRETGGNVPFARESAGLRHSIQRCISLYLKSIGLSPQ
jgi:hypothetical protein